MRRVWNSKLAAPLIILGLLIVLIFALMLRWHDAPNAARGEPSTPGADDGQVTESKEPNSIVEPQLPAWERPATTDPKAYAIAFGTAIWTYDSSVHGYFDWQDAVTAFANPLESPDAGRVARSMLPYATQWEDLKVHEARASVLDVTAATTPELVALARDPRAPAGWHGFVVRGTQESVLDGEMTRSQRHVTVGVICRPRCSFWSASNELPQ
ncbi:hypothetical protein OG555_19015 [Kribbella sp. NBC_01484]|uniref:hypothetical protein n=1 Tax=Kribbella sp. NBC_01484 TaxID=2903579 RepID=UPI002E2FC42D|nr:hypothetical protein [Kribbella sp. NBC_01484]